MIDVNRKFIEKHFGELHRQAEPASDQTILNAINFEKQGGCRKEVWTEYSVALHARRSTIAQFHANNEIETLLMIGFAMGYREAKAETR